MKTTLKFYILQSSVKIYDYNFQKILCKRIQKHHTWFALSTSASKISISEDLKTKWDKNIQVLHKGISIHIEVSYSIQWLNTATHRTTEADQDLSSPCLNAPITLKTLLLLVCILCFETEIIVVIYDNH